MARPGVGFEDIAGAADALLDAGERPTTERVRGFLGRGSPNTIGPLLDRWWATLGPRLRQQQAKLDMPDAPPEVARLATELWANALAAAKQVAEAELAGERTALEAAHRALQAERETHQTDRAAAETAAAEAATAQRLAETRLSDAHQLSKQQALQVGDLTQQRDALQVRCDRQEVELAAVTERLRQFQTNFTAEHAAQAAHLRATEDRAHAEIDRARQETKDLRAQMAAVARERKAADLKLQQQRDAAVITTVAAQREAGVQRGRADALEEQLARLEARQAKRQVASSHAAEGKRPAPRATPTARSPKPRSKLRNS